jgi:hypothetical protein
MENLMSGDQTKVGDRKMGDRKMSINPKGFIFLSPLFSCPAFLVSVGFRQSQLFVCPPTFVGCQPAGVLLQS